MADKAQLRRQVARLKAERDAALEVVEALHLRLLELTCGNRYELPQPLRDELAALARVADGRAA